MKNQTTAHQRQDEYSMEIKFVVSYFPIIVRNISFNWKTHFSTEQLFL